MADVILDVLGASGTVLANLSGFAVDPLWPEDGADIAPIEVPAVAGAATAPASFSLPSAPAVIAGTFLFDYYYRIWIIPSVMNVQNPRYNVGIPFHVWNAYPQPYVNSLDAITLVNGTGLTFDVSPPSDFKAIEYREVNITITPAAGISVDAEITFDFSEGLGTLFFRAEIADFVQMAPDPPVVETLEWLTDIIPAHKGKEQRIALRSSPRRGIRYSFILENEDERRRQYRRWYKSMGSRIVLPFYQYSTRLTASSASGTSQLYFDPANTDLREGEFAILYRARTDEGFLVKLGALAVDGAALDTPLTFDATTDMVIAPCFTSRLLDRTGLSMYSVTGEISIQAEVMDTRPLFSRPGSTAVISSFDGYNVLDRRPVVVGETPELFDRNYEVMDNKTGLQESYYSWPHPAVGGSKQWRIRRRVNPVEMDWWRDFLAAAEGQQNPFLMPTWFEDLVAAEAPATGSSSLLLQASDYASLYHPYETYKRLQIETAAGTIWKKVLTATDNPDGTATLELDTPFGPNPEDVIINRISFLNLTRFASDTVTLTHDHLTTLLEVPTRTVDE